MPIVVRRSFPRICLFALSLVAAPVHAGPPSSPPPAATQAFESGLAAYEAGDFAGAATQWEQALHATPDTPAFAIARTRLGLDIATAFERQFDGTGDRTSLERAAEYMNWFASLVEPVYRSDPATMALERQRADERLSRIQNKLAALDAVPAEAPPPESVAVTPPPADRPPADELPADTPPTKRGNGLIAVGVLSLVGSVAGVTLMGVGMGMARNASDFSGVDPFDFQTRREQIERGERGERMAVAGGIVGGVLLAPAIALLAVGAKRKKQSRVSASFAGPGLAGLKLEGRF